MNKLRLAIIGAGGISNSHVRAYKQMEDVEIVAGADIIPGKAREALGRWEFPEAKAYEDTQKMLDEVKPDAVSVCTYNTAHAVCAAAAMKAGAHVLLEKPMTVTLEDAQMLRRVEKETGKILTIGFQPRYDDRMKRIKEVVQSGRLGDVYYVQTGGGRRRGIPGSTFIEERYAGVGALADIGCYSLDMVLNALGYPKPVTVSAVSFDHFGRNPKYTPPEDAARFSVDDFCGAFIRLETGAVIDFRMSWAMHMDTTGSTIFLGTDAGLKVEPANPESLWGGAWDGSCGNVTLFHDEFGTPTHTPIPLPAPRGDKLDCFYHKCRAFVDAVKTGGKAPIPTSEIIYNQAIIDGIIRSCKCGHEVEVHIEEI